MNSPDTNNDKKYEFILRIEIDYRSFIGFCIAECMLVQIHCLMEKSNRRWL